VSVSDVIYINLCTMNDSQNWYIIMNESTVVDYILKKIGYIASNHMIVRSIGCKGDEGFDYEDEDVEVDVGVEAKSRDVVVGTTAGMGRSVASGTSCIVS